MIQFSEDFSDHLDFFSDHLDHQDTFHIIQTLFGSSGHFSAHLDTFRLIWTLRRSSADFLYLIAPKTFLIFSGLAK